MATLAYNAEEIGARALDPRLLELDGISRPDDRGPLQALPGLRGKAKRDPRQARGGRRRGREPGLLGHPRAQGRPHVRSRGREEPRGLLRAPGRRRRRSRAARRHLFERDFGSMHAWRQVQGDGHGRARLGLDCIRLGRGPPLQLRRRRPEHVSRSGTRRRSSRSTSTSTRTSSTTRPTVPPTSTRSSTNLDWGVVNGWIAAYGITCA